MRALIERRLWVKAHAQECDCVVSVIAKPGKEKRSIHVSRCDRKHNDTIRKLTKKAEDEVDALLLAVQ
jgi:hypothetical protein